MMSLEAIVFSALGTINALLMGAVAWFSKDYIKDIRETLKSIDDKFLMLNNSNIQNGAEISHLKVRVDKVENRLDKANI